MKNFIGFILSLTASTTFAALPPTFLKGQSDAANTVNFNTQVPQSQATRINATTGLIETGNDNRLKNPGCEALTAGSGWTSVNGGTITTSGATVYDGVKSCTQTPVSATGILAYQTIAPTATGYAGNFEVSTFAWAQNAGLQVCAMSGTSTILQCLDVLTDSTWHQYTLPYAYPGGTVAVGIAYYAKSTFSSQFYWDNAYAIFGAKSIGQISQASFFGSAEQPGGANCQYSETSSTSEASYVDLGAGAGCAQAWNTTGGITVPGGPTTYQITGANMPSGTYVISVSGLFLNNAASTVCNFQMSDGTTPFGYTASNLGGSGLSNIGSGNIIGAITYTSPGSHTFKIQASANSTNTCYLQNTSVGRRMTWTVQYMPSQSQTISTANMQPAYAGKQWLGVSNANILVGISAAPSTTRTTLANAQMATYTKLGSVIDDLSTNVQVSAALPAGEYEAELTAFLETSSAASGATTSCVYELWDGTTSIGSVLTSSAAQAAQSFQDISHVRGYFKLTSPATKTIVVRAAKVGGDTSGASYCQLFTDGGTSTRPAMLTIKPYTQTGPALLIANSVISSSPGVERIDRLMMLTPCTTNGVCAVTSSSGGLAVTRTAAGIYNLTYPAYSAAPTCIVTIAPTSVANGTPRLGNTPTTTTTVVALANGSTSAAIDEGFMVICQGPR